MTKIFSQVIPESINSSNTVPSRRRIHWLKPAIIVVCFVAGVAYAAGHHAFYQSLHSSFVDDAFLSQQLNHAIGTAFTFLVRAAFVMTIGTSYWQIYWGIVTRKPFAVSTLDSLHDFLGSLLAFFNFRALVASPLLVLVAFISWTVPLATILPPATLSINSTTLIEHVPHHLPFINFSSNAALDAHDLPGGEQRVYTFYRKPTRQMTRLAVGTAYRGAIPELTGPEVNATYTSRFYAPAVRCQSLDPEILIGFNGSDHCDLTIVHKHADLQGGCTKNPLKHIAWAPSDSKLVPFQPSAISDDWTLPLESSDDGISPSSYVGSHKQDPAELFIGTRPDAFTDWTMYNCSLFNASYTVDFAFNDFQRGISEIKNVGILQSVPFTKETANRNASDIFDYSALNYQALMESLGQLLVGTIAQRLPSGPAVDSFVAHDTQIMTTLLAYTKDMLPLSKRQFNATQFPTGTNGYVVSDTKPDADGNVYGLPREAFDTSTYNKSLGWAVEQLFQNITLSLLSSPAFVSNDIEATNVIVLRSKNMYVYSSSRLWLSYGIAIGVTLVVAAVGMTSIFRNGVSYSNNFSTTMRTITGLQIDQLVNIPARNGADPLPKDIGIAKIKLGSAAQGAKEGEISEIELRENNSPERSFIDTSHGKVEENDRLL